MSKKATPKFTSDAGESADPCVEAGPRANASGRKKRILQGIGFGIRRFAPAVLAVLVLAQARPLTAQTKVIARIEVEGNVRVARETILFYSSLKPGDPFDPSLLQQDIKKLWETRFFDDIKVDANEQPEGLVLTYIVKERPIIASLEYTGSKQLTQETIKKELKERKLKLLEGDPVDKALLGRVKNTIEELLEHKGFRFSKVEIKTEDMGGERWAITFDINDGGKVKIKKIRFEGNQAFSDGRLRGTFKKTKQQGFWSFIKKGTTYDPDRIQQDLERLREFYFNHGYIRFNVGEPRLDVIENADGKRHLEITVTVEEEKPYKVADVTISGNKLFDDRELKPLLAVKPNKTVRRKDLIDTRSALEAKYGEKGYINASPSPLMEPVEGATEPKVNVVFDIDEGEQVRVNRIEFKGNSSTKDKVIRRQLKLDEGDVFNLKHFNRSLMRIYQTGFFGPPRPRVEPLRDDPTRVDLTIELEEQGKNDIRFGGGVSQVEGFFGTFAFSTRNFIGTGNSLTVDIQAGARTDNYRLMYLDPFVMDRPISFGVDMFKRNVDYTQYKRNGLGGNLTLGTQFTDFLAGRIQYSYEDVEVRDVDATLITNPTSLALLQEGDFRISKLTPTLLYSSVDNPIDPFRGFRQVVSFELAGGFLKGVSSFYKPRIDTTLYLPFGKKMNLGLHGEYSLVRGFGEGEVPIFERFFIGGEQSIRGYESRSISPVDEDGNRIGGTKALIFNAEYQVKLAQPFRFVTFFDVGQSFAENDTVGVSDFLYSMGLEFRFFTPILQAPLRLIYSYVPKPLEGEPKTDFTFSIGTTF